ncbi:MULTISPECIES: hemolysin family protein [unclassified Saccharibacter]|uniref:hemolysin family protein n=1 Tax=unclassified Saccharibacter TaxID=2648722 RepID=UPI001323F3F4|nr:MULTISPECIES: hemolysin family protein [unclassified Saccharibacter]MXV35341.1 CBS domain-containing protein [Saccharibacter sp. EH611]MXV57811.1 CBS domain-containing protein [Saccharibacter sp. EH70]MXV65275.1 CBS domain-containing protein [Saccharibacter sp. EH60]
MTSDHSSSSLSSFFNFFHRKSRDYNLRHAIEEIVSEASHRAATSQETPELDRQERALIMNVLHLRNITADDVMVPRADIVAMPDHISFEDALALVRQEHHSRMPVYHDQLDDIVGMIHVKDLITHLDEKAPFNIQSLLRQPLLIAPTIPVLDLQLQMRQRRTHMALVIDEYGSIDGLVTIEDLIEKIVGDISDEHDDPVETPWIERPDGSIDLDARLSVKELEQRFGEVLTSEEREAEIETVGGLVFHLAEHVPARDEVLTHPSGIEFRVLEADARHILTLRMHLPPDWSKRHDPPNLEEDISPALDA